MWHSFLPVLPPLAQAVVKISGHGAGPVFLEQLENVDPDPTQIFNRLLTLKKDPPTGRVDSQFPIIFMNEIESTGREWKSFVMRPVMRAEGWGGVRAVQWLRHTVRIVLAGLFIYAGAIKFIQPEVFLADVESYRLLPYWLAWGVALYLPPFEIVCGLALLFPRIRNAGGSILILLMGVFIVAIAVAWIRGLDISCGCFGNSGESANYLWLIVRDLLIVAALFFAGCGTFLHRNKYE